MSNTFEVKDGETISPKAGEVYNVRSGSVTVVGQTGGYTNEK